MQPMPGALVFRTPNGDPLECHCSGAALRVGGEFGPRTILLRSRPKNEAIVSFAAVNQKIGDLLREVRGRHRAEADLRELNDTLEQRIEMRTQEIRDVFSRLYESERQFRNLVESVTDYAIFMLDQNGLVATWNAGAERIKGYTNDEIIGQHFSIFYTEDDRRNAVPEQVLQPLDAPAVSQWKDGEFAKAVICFGLASSSMKSTMKKAVLLDLPRSRVI